MPTGIGNSENRSTTPSRVTTTRVVAEQPGLAGDGVFLSTAAGRPEHRPNWEPGTQLGRFIIQRFLGQGNLGDVCLAEDTVSQQDVALKIVVLDPGHADDLACRLRSEKQVSDRIRDHRHVLKTHDLHQLSWEGLELMVLSMEYADGGTLRDWLREHRADLDRRRTEGLIIFKQVCRGLMAIHGAGVIHLDPKPENILKGGDAWKVADLSLCSQVQGAKPLSASSSTDPRTTVAGTFEYMSPEQRSGTPAADLDERSDIYSMGVVLHEILQHQCRRPLRGLPCAGRCPERRRPAAIAGIDPTTAQVIQKCLAEDPAYRYPSVGRLLAALNGRTDPTHRIKRLWAEACQLIGAKRFPQAEELCQEILQRRPNHREARALLNDLQTRDQSATQLYAAIEQDLDRRNLEELGLMLTTAVSMYPEHPAGRAVQIRLQVKANQYRTAMQEGAAALRRADWAAAAMWFGRGRELNPGAVVSEGAARLATGILDHVTRARQQIDQAIAARDRDRAMALAREHDDYLNRTREQIQPSGANP